MRKPPDHPSQDRGRRRVRRSQRRSRRGSESGGAADAGDRTVPGARGGIDLVLQPIVVAPESAAIDRFRGGTAAATDRQTLQAAVARPLLGQQEFANLVKVRCRNCRDTSRPTKDKEIDGNGTACERTPQ